MLSRLLHSNYPSHSNDSFLFELPSLSPTSRREGSDPWRRPRRNSNESVISPERTHLEYRDNSTYEKNLAMLQQGLEDSTKAFEEQKEKERRESREFERALAESRLSSNPNFTPINRGARQVLEESRRKLESAAGRKLPVRKRSLSVDSSPNSPAIPRSPNELAASERAWLESKMEKGKFILEDDVRSFSILPAGAMRPERIFGDDLEDPLERRMLEIAIQLSLEGSEARDRPPTSTPPPLPPRKGSNFSTNSRDQLSTHSNFLTFSPSTSSTTFHSVTSHKSNSPPVLPPRSATRPLSWIPPARPKIFTAVDNRSESPIDRPYLSPTLDEKSHSKFLEEMDDENNLVSASPGGQLEVRNGPVEISPTDTVQSLATVTAPEFEPEILNIGASEELQRQLEKDINTTMNLGDRPRVSSTSSRESGITFGYLNEMEFLEFPERIILGQERKEWIIESGNYLSLLRGLMWHSSRVICGEGSNDIDASLKLTFAVDAQGRPKIRMSVTLLSPNQFNYSQEEIQLTSSSSGAEKGKGPSQSEKVFSLPDLILLPSSLGIISNTLYTLRYLSSIALSTNPSQSPTNAFIALKELGKILSIESNTTTSTLPNEKLVDRLKNRLSKRGWIQGGKQSVGGNKLIKLPSDLIAKGVRVDRQVRVLSSDEGGDQEIDGTSSGREE